MKFSKTFKKVLDNSKEYDSKNATYLTKAGYIKQTASGVYTLLPAGLRVVRKIEQIVREEMDKVGEEILLPAIVPAEIWEKTGRDQSVGILFEASGANKDSKTLNSTRYILNPTHEDTVTHALSERVSSYKDLPFAVYQIQTKFRNEARPKSGLLRLREFIMKDLYSFHDSEEDLLRYYNGEATQAYRNVYERLGLKGLVIEAYASGGDFTDEYSKEFQLKCEIGEDIVFIADGEEIGYNLEVAPSMAPSSSTDGNSEEPLGLVETLGATTMQKLIDQLDVSLDQTVKTLVYLHGDDQLLVVCVRGDYEVNELKLKKVLPGIKGLRLADREVVEELSGASTGYAGPLGLNDSMEYKVIYDESLKSVKNMVLGGNKSDHHYVNANWDRDLDTPEEFYDFKLAKVGDLNPETGEEWGTIVTTEVGNIFPLNTRFSDAFNMRYVDSDNKTQQVYMGSYGIGITRLVGAMAEVLSDDKGLVWPVSIAPYSVQIVSIGKTDEVYTISQSLYDDLKSAGHEVVWDDRNEAGFGRKLQDWELSGVPKVIIIGNKALEDGSVEIRERATGDIISVPIAEVIQALS